MRTHGRGGFESSRCLVRDETGGMPTTVGPALDPIENARYLRGVIGLDLLHTIDEPIGFRCPRGLRPQGVEANQGLSPHDSTRSTWTC